MENTAFDGTKLITYDEFNGNTNYTWMDYNCYNPSNTSWLSHPYSWPYGATHTNVLEIAGAHDRTVTNYNWQSGPLGAFYLPTDSDLIGVGSDHADALGLYHYTTQTNQTKETTSTVDIGYHYVALDANGNAVDTDGDGIPDYLEDVNGNGSYNSGTDVGDWELADSDEDGRMDEIFKVRIFAPR